MSEEFKKCYIENVMNELIRELSDPLCVDESKPEMLVYKMGYEHAMDKISCYVSLLKKALEV